MVILFGSRATGRHQEDSDLDIMAVTLPDYPPASRVGASRAGSDYTEDNPPPSEVNVIQMSRRGFDFCRDASPHIARQAANHRTSMNGEARGATTPRGRFPGPLGRNATVCPTSLGKQPGVCVDG